ncbi:MAG: LysR family transcriptional regulator [Clostridia bacterium]|nr:LysR family transcriptional regulator [Clostridia bacterium]
MQTSYLRYMVEIERTRSITQAAANLFLSQPNLSRILREVEEQLGYALFERTSRGVRPTEAGNAFLRHARRILAEVEAIEGIGVGRRQPDRFRICMPRSTGIMALTIDYLNTLPPDRSLDAMLRECHVRRAFDSIAAGEADLAIIRYRAEYQRYFEDQAAENRLGFELLNSYRYRITLQRDHPLARQEEIAASDLDALTEIIHGDTFRAHGVSGGPRKRIHSVDRHAQLMLVSRVPDAFMWSTTVLPEDLERWNLVQRSVVDNRVEYCNALVCVGPEQLNDIERGYTAYIRERHGL